MIKLLGVAVVASLLSTATHARLETRSLGIAIMISYTPTVCARTATLTLITVKEENRKVMKNKK